VKSKSDTKKNGIAQLKWLIIALVCFVVIVLVWFVTMLYQSNTSGNYAQEIAKPLESALVDAGAVKNCSRGSTGRASDSNEPSYYAIYSIPSGRENATKVIMDATRETGYTLTVDESPADPQDNVFYADRTSKKSTYPDLQDGTVNLLVTVFGSSTHSGEGDEFCTVSKRDTPPSDQTTVRFTVNLPAYK
jgi:hypothetical protein